MDARPLLVRVARAMQKAKLDAVLIGNAAAALQGAPVTTDDFDFMIRTAKVTLPKHRALARTLDGTLFRPFYPVSNLFRLEDDSGQLHVDFMGSGASHRCAPARRWSTSRASPCESRASRTSSRARVRPAAPRIWRYFRF